MVQFQSILEHTFAAMSSRPRDVYVVEGPFNMYYCAVFEPTVRHTPDVLLTAPSLAQLKEKYKLFRVIDGRRAVSLHHENF